MQTFKVVVAGGREFNDLALLTKEMDNVLRRKVKTCKIVIVCGMARGADLL